MRKRRKKEKKNLEFMWMVYSFPFFMTIFGVKIHKEQKKIGIDRTRFKLVELLMFLMAFLR